MEEDDKSLVRFPTWENLSSFLSQPRRQTRFLHIEADTLAFSIVHLHKDIVQPCRWCSDQEMTVKDGYYAQFKLENDIFVYFEIQLDRKIDDIDLDFARVEEKNLDLRFMGMVHLTDPLLTIVYKQY